MARSIPKVKKAYTQREQGGRYMWEQAKRVQVRAAAGSGAHNPQRRLESLKKLRQKLQAEDAPNLTAVQLERLAELEATEKELALVRPSQARASGYCGGAPGEPQGSRNTSLRASRP